MSREMTRLPDDVARRVSEAMESGLAAMRANLERTYCDETG
jgi:hypothetical protein